MATRGMRPFSAGDMSFVSRLPPESGVKFALSSRVIMGHAALSAAPAGTVWMPTPRRSRRTPHSPDLDFDDTQ